LIYQVPQHFNIIFHFFIKKIYKEAGGRVVDGNFYGNLCKIFNFFKKN